MPRRLADKSRHVRPRRFRKREKTYRSVPFQRAPVAVGQEIKVVINDIGSGGDGIARMGSFLIFVPQAKIGERLNIRIVRVTRKFAIAEKIKQDEEEKLED